MSDHAVRLVLSSFNRLENIAFIMIDFGIYSENEGTPHETLLWHDATPDSECTE